MVSRRRLKKPSPHHTHDLTIDHINGDPFDNTWGNLQVVCRGLNASRGAH